MISTTEPTEQKARRRLCNRLKYDLAALCAAVVGIAYRAKSS
jgi:hypothetical protein